MTSVLPRVSISPVIVADMNAKSMHIPISICLEGQIVETKALIDSGAGGTFIDRNFATRNKVPLRSLKQPIKVYNVDGTRNKEGIIDHIAKTDIQISGHKTETELLATGLGKESVILGMPWLRKVNPIIDWSKGTMEIPDRSETLEDICATLLEPEEELKDDEILLAYTQGEPILGIMDPGKQPLSHEYKEPRYKRTQKGANIFIGRITINHQSARYSFAQNVWIQAKSTPS